MTSAKYIISIMIIAILFLAIIIFLVEQPKPINTSPKEHSIETNKDKCVKDILLRSGSIILVIDSIIIVTDGEIVKC